MCFPILVITTPAPCLRASSMTICPITRAFYLHILPSRKLRKEAQLLKEQADVAHAHIDPVGCLISAHIVVAKEYGARIVVTIAQHVAAERALAHTACSLNKIQMPFSKLASLFQISESISALSEKTWGSTSLNIILFIDYLFLDFITQTTAFTLFIIGFTMSNILFPATPLPTRAFIFNTIAIRSPTIMRLMLDGMGFATFSICYTGAGDTPDMAYNTSPYNPNEKPISPLL